jgi:hypothetical protein
MAYETVALKPPGKTEQAERFAEPSPGEAGGGPFSATVADRVADTGCFERNPQIVTHVFVECSRWGSNLQPSAPEADALSN